MVGELLGVDSSSSFRCPVELVVVVTTTTDREGGIRFSADVDIEVESKQRREKEISGGLVSKWSIRVRHPPRSVTHVSKASVVSRWAWTDSWCDPARP